jgi:hypothetical protein
MPSSLPIPEETFPAKKSMPGMFPLYSKSTHPSVLFHLVWTYVCNFLGEEARSPLDKAGFHETQA